MAMDEIAMVEGDELESLIDHLEKLVEHQRLDCALRAGYVRFCVDDGALKFKAGGGPWSRPFGHAETRQ